MVWRAFTSDEVFSGVINKNHCCNSDPKRSHSVNLGTVKDNFCDNSVHSFALDVIVCCKR
jgi:hypothetical protein